MLICQSFKPGHNAHWMQLRESEAPVNAMVSCLEVTPSDPGDEDTPQDLREFRLLLAPEGDGPWWAIPAEELVSRLHNPGWLQRLVAQVDTAFTYCRSGRLLGATHPAIVGALVFCPSFAETTPRQYGGEDSPLRATVAQVLVDGLLGSLDPEL